MNNFIQNLHSYWAYLVVFLILVSVINAVKLKFTKTSVKKADKFLALFTMISAHTQLLIGIILYIVSPKIQALMKNMGTTMKDAPSRLAVVEHPITMILVVVFLTICNKKIKQSFILQRGIPPIAVLFYAISLGLVFLMIPWDLWLGR